MILVWMLLPECCLQRMSGRYEPHYEPSHNVYKGTFSPPTNSRFTIDKRYRSSESSTTVSAKQLKPLHAVYNVT
jgi:hypothetical protein